MMIYKKNIIYTLIFLFGLYFLINNIFNFYKGDRVSLLDRRAQYLYMFGKHLQSIKISELIAVTDAPSSAYFKGFLKSGIEVKEYIEGLDDLFMEGEIKNEWSLKLSATKCIYFDIGVELNENHIHFLNEYFDSGGVLLIKNVEYIPLKVEFVREFLLRGIAKDQIFAFGRKPIENNNNWDRLKGLNEVEYVNQVSLLYTKDNIDMLKLFLKDITEENQLKEGTSNEN